MSYYTSEKTGVIVNKRTLAGETVVALEWTGDHGKHIELAVARDYNTRQWLDSLVADTIPRTYTLVMRRRSSPLEIVITGFDTPTMDQVEAALTARRQKYYE